MRMGLDEPSDDLARTVSALLDGIVLQQRFFGDAEATRRAVERLRGLLLSAGARDSAAHVARHHGHALSNPSRTPEPTGDSNRRLPLLVSPCPGRRGAAMRCDRV